MATIFSKIISGEIPCYKVSENKDFLAFLDIMPLTKGHVLVIPKNEIDYIFDMDDDHLAAFINFAKEVSHKIKKVFPCRKIGMSVVGLEVPHAHIHLIPINSVSDMNFAKVKLQLTSEELTQIAASILEA